MQKAELVRVALVKLLCAVQFGMAQARGIGAQSANPVKPAHVLHQRIAEMVGMRAVDHEIDSLRACCGIHFGDGIGERLSRWQTTIRLDREGNCGRHASFFDKEHSAIHASSSSYDDPKTKLCSKNGNINTILKQNNSPMSGLYKLKHIARQRGCP